MNLWREQESAAFAGGDRALSFFVPGCFASDAASAGLNFSFFDCATVPAGPYFTVLSAGSDGADHVAGYTILQHIVRSFTRWITVTAKALRRLVCREGRTCRTCRTGRTCRTNRALGLSFAGGLRL